MGIFGWLSYTHATMELNRGIILGSYCYTNSFSFGGCARVRIGQQTIYSLLYVFTHVHFAALFLGFNRIMIGLLDFRAVSYRRNYLFVFELNTLCIHVCMCVCMCVSVQTKTRKGSQWVYVRSLQLMHAILHYISYAKGKESIFFFHFYFLLLSQSRAIDKLTWSRAINIYICATFDITLEIQWTTLVVTNHYFIYRYTFIRKFTVKRNIIQTLYETYYSRISYFAQER